VYCQTRSHTTPYRFTPMTNLSLLGFALACCAPILFSGPRQAPPATTPATTGLGSPVDCSGCVAGSTNAMPTGSQPPGCTASISLTIFVTPGTCEGMCADPDPCYIYWDFSWSLAGTCMVERCYTTKYTAPDGTVTNGGPFCTSVSGGDSGSGNSGQNPIALLCGASLRVSIALGTYSVFAVGQCSDCDES